jgi:hypothetical protein
MVTKIKNPGTNSATLDIIVNDQSVSHAQSIATGESSIRTPLPPTHTDISIRYTGTKALVILETAFE